VAQISTVSPSTPDFEIHERRGGFSTAIVLTSCRALPSWQVTTANYCHYQIQSSPPGNTIECSLHPKAGKLSTGQRTKKPSWPQLLPIVEEHPLPLKKANYEDNKG